MHYDGRYWLDGNTRIDYFRGMEHIDINRHDIYYRASLARDPRFDGVFFVGVTSTGIYCRPICPARKPRRENCHFFISAAAAEKAAFRPCLRCRPELAPGFAPVDDAARIAGRIAHLIEEELVQNHASIEDLAGRFELSTRQLRRIVQDHFGVSPMELVMTRRLLLAKQLLTETPLPVTAIAFASGFSSVRRFNDAFLGRYQMPPGRLRKETRSAGETTATNSEAITLFLSYRPPFDWESLLRFLKARRLTGVEHLEDHRYIRSLEVEQHRGWLEVQHKPDLHKLSVRMAPSLIPALPVVLNRLHHLFDLNARPDVIASHLSDDPRLKESIERHPGLRVPGALDGFEVAIRAILGQQITVKAANTLAKRFIAVFGERVETPYPELTALFPTPNRIARAGVDEIASLGIIQRRAESILRLAREVDSGRLELDAGALVERTIELLVALPGIGPWTAQYIALRALQWPDAFLKEDMALRKALGGVTAARAEHISQPWRPWRSYATMHLWNQYLREHA